MSSAVKKIQIVLSERGDIWIEEFEVSEDETLRSVLKRRGFKTFVVDGQFDLDNPQDVRDGMILHVKIFE